MVKDRFNTCKVGKLYMVVCPECKQWYERKTMVVINYGLPDQSEVCVGCYEDNHFIPPEPLKEGEKQCLK